MITLLKNSMKASVRDSFFSVFLIILLISIGVNCFNFSLYQFREAQRLERIHSGGQTYTLSFSPSLNSEELNSILKSYEALIECAYSITSEYGNNLRVYFCGNYDVSHGSKDLKENQIVVGEEKRKSGVKIDDTVKIDGCEYTVIGFRAGGEYDEISLSSLHNRYMLEELTVTFKNILSAKEQNRFFEEIGKVFEITDVKEPASRADSTRYLYLFKSAVLSLSIVLCNIGFVVFFFLNKKETAVSIMILCGATRLQTVLLSAIEMALYSVLGILTGNLFFFIFFSKGFITDYSVSAVDIILSCIVGLLITVVPVFVLTSARAIRNEKGR